eukprot:COSAG03_NODE_2034_length_3199_cov_1282.360000_5_plen_143_part_00
MTGCLHICVPVFDTSEQKCICGAGYATNEPRDFEGDNEDQNGGVGPPTGIYYPKMLQQQEQPLSVCRSVFDFNNMSLFALVPSCCCHGRQCGAIASSFSECHAVCFGTGICAYNDAQARDAHRSYFARPFLGAVRSRRGPTR